MSIEYKPDQFLEVAPDISRVYGMLRLEQVDFRVLLQGTQGFLRELVVLEECALNQSELLRELGFQNALNIGVLHRI